MRPFSYQNGRQSQKMGKKNENFDFDGLELPENCNKPECFVHCWKAYLIGYIFVIQKITLKCNPDFSRFFVKLVQKPVF